MRYPLLSIFCLILQNVGRSSHRCRRQRLCYGHLPSDWVLPMTLDEAFGTAGTSDDDFCDHAEAGLDLARRELVCLLERLIGEVEGSIKTPIAGLTLHRIVRTGGPKPDSLERAFGFVRPYPFPRDGRGRTAWRNLAAWFGGRSRDACAIQP